MYFLNVCLYWKEEAYSGIQSYCHTLALCHILLHSIWPFLPPRNNIQTLIQKTKNKLGIIKKVRSHFEWTLCIEFNAFCLCIKTVKVFNDIMCM